MTSPATLVRLHANRIFRRRILSDGSQRGLENYYAFHHKEYPEWWASIATSVSESDILGAYEVTPGSSEGALVLTSEELIVLGSESKRIRYDSIDTMDRIYKEPVSQEIGCNLFGGEHITIPVRNGTGAIATVMHFVLQAMSAYKRAAERSSPQ